MRMIKPVTSFKKDFKRIKSNPRHVNDLDRLLAGILPLLTKDIPLPDIYRDHNLVGEWTGYRECHLKPDLLLIYKLVGNDILQFVRLGSHSDIFGK